MPTWLSVLTNTDPATYAVDALRNTMLGIGNKSFEIDVVVLVAFTTVLGAFGAYSFGRMKAV